MGVARPGTREFAGTGGRAHDVMGQRTGIEQPA
jgi:hypothetical protein